MPSDAEPVFPSSSKFEDSAGSRLPLVAPGMRLSNTRALSELAESKRSRIFRVAFSAEKPVPTFSGKCSSRATTPAAKEATLLIDDGAALRRTDGRPRLTPMEKRDVILRGMTCENVTIKAIRDPITAYVAKRPVRAHFRAWCLSTISRAGASSTLKRRVGSRNHGYLAICANLYERAARAPGRRRRQSARRRRHCDAQMVGDTEAAVEVDARESNHNGKVGISAPVSGGRHAFIYACQRKDVDACATLGGAW